MAILLFNLTQHVMTKEQVADFAACYGGSVAPRGEELTVIVKKELTFFVAPTAEEVKSRATTLANLAIEQGANYALIGGAPYLMAPLTTALKERGITPLFSFSERVSSEFINEEGEVIKTNKFVHKSFIEG